MQRKCIVVLGFMGRCPVAGVQWQHLHYIVGLQRLGHDVYYIEDSASLPMDPESFLETTDFTHAAGLLRKLAIEFGFEDRWAYCARYLRAPETAGLSLARIRELYKNADLLLNVCGSQEFHEDLRNNDRLIYVESDPGVEQIRVDKGEPTTIEYLRRHRSLFTFGENVGTGTFPVPTHGFRWLPTRQPVVTSFWNTESAPPAGSVFTTIANWNTSGKKDIEWRGETYRWSKSLEFLQFVEAPLRSGEPFELAAGIRDPRIADQFTANRWRLTSPGAMSTSIHDYRSYLHRSKGEFSVAKDQYTRLRTGWFSDRSVCYLAAGRPVVVQDTGFPDHIETGRGLFAFSDLDGIRDAVRTINADYAAHSRRARQVACEYFEASKVLASLLDRA